MLTGNVELHTGDKKARSAARQSLKPTQQHTLRQKSMVTVGGNVPLAVGGVVDVGAGGLAVCESPTVNAVSWAKLRFGTV